ncbi:MAG: hypothetical protein OEQ13_14565 [Acidobacteriota bacterium]|nr:hypothetical protein [Acidobacteriota bacterium]
MGKRNYYSADKRTQEIKRKKKAQEKLERKRLKKLQAADDEQTDIDRPDTEETSEDGADQPTDTTT